MTFCYYSHNNIELQKNQQKCYNLFTNTPGEKRVSFFQKRIRPLRASDASARRPPGLLKELSFQSFSGGKEEKSMENNRSSWGSNLGFLLAAIGSAVGLGNIWGFPYKMGQSGGFTFLLVYLLLAVFVGLTIMVSELAIGRRRA
jgi:hypothetical protein